MDVDQPGLVELVGREPEQLAAHSTDRVLAVATSTVQHSTAVAAVDAVDFVQIKFAVVDVGQLTAVVAVAHSGAAAAAEAVADDGRKGSVAGWVVAGQGTAAVAVAVV